MRLSWLQILLADLGLAGVIALVTGMALGSVINGVIGAIAAVFVFVVGARIAFNIVDGVRRLR